jgi:hypothetical protein
MSYIIINKQDTTWTNFLKIGDPVLINNVFGFGHYGEVKKIYFDSVGTQLFDVQSFQENLFVPALSGFSTAAYTANELAPPGKATGIKDVGKNKKR